jgi:SAM-dependent methyltransferase
LRGVRPRESVDLVPKRVPETESRTPDQLREHYEVEKELANRLRLAPSDERRELYRSVYDELFRRVPTHPQVTRRDTDPAVAAAAVAAQVEILAPLLRPTSTFLEVGAGDCALSAAIAPRVGKVYAVDVSEEVARGVTLPASVDVRLSDGTDIPVPPASVDLVYSNQLMEHLHPDDALEQVSNIYDCLRPGGAYVCITPHRLTGPHDISAYFDDTPSGFHLKEYTISELVSLFSRVGFSSVKVLVGARGRFVQMRPWLAQILEALLGRLPVRARRALAQRLHLNLVLGIRVLAKK